jgi:hypothetical protein
MGQTIKLSRHTICRKQEHVVDWPSDVDSRETLLPPVKSTITSICDAIQTLNWKLSYASTTSQTLVDKNNANGQGRNQHHHPSVPTKAIQEIVGRSRKHTIRFRTSHKSYQRFSQYRCSHSILQNKLAEVYGSSIAQMR